MLLSIACGYVALADKYQDFVQALSPRSPIRPQVFSIGYAACEDINVQATDFFPRLMEKYELEGVKPKHHATLLDVRSVVESFLFSFQHGANAELRVDPAIFSDIEELARTVPNKVFPGGNALCIAHRIAKEEPKHTVKLGAQVNAALQEKLGKRGIQVVQDTATTSDNMDVHLAIEYITGDVIANVTAPRMNRFYMNADKHNAELTAAKSLHELTAPTDVFVISGLQLSLPSRPQDLDAVSAALNRHPGGSHFESGSYEEKTLFKNIWNKGIFLSTRSLGVNEQELALLDHVLKTKDPSSAPQVTDSSPDANWALDTVLGVLRSVKNIAHSRLSRIHMHALGFQVLCFDPDVWSSGRDALAAASLVASELACGDALKEHTWDSFRPLSELPMMNLDGSGLRCGYPDVYRDFECCVAPVLVCEIPVRTAGIGDNISGAGLARQVYTGKAREEL